MIDVETIVATIKAEYLRGDLNIIDAIEKLEVNCGLEPDEAETEVYKWEEGNTG